METNETKSEKLPSCLIVDDNEDWLRLMRLLVHQPRLVLTSRPKEVPRIIEAENVQLLITDTNMPEMSGIELLKLVRSDPRWQHLPIMVLFDGLNGSTLKKADIIKMGATIVMTKDEFFAQLHYLLGDLFRS